MSGSEQFYDQMAGDYDDAILRCVPRYFEMHEAILAYVPAALRPKRILELGSGSGHLTRRILKTYPEARVYAVDVSREMIVECRRTTGDDALGFVRMDFHELCFSPRVFDLVVSSISIHHIDHKAKRKLFREVHDCLRPGGVLAYSDQFAGDDDEIYARHIRAWKEESARLGASNAEWRTWMQHQDDHDHHASLRDQLRCLEEAGFGTTACVWRYLLWTFVLAIRQSQ